MNLIPNYVKLLIGVSALFCCILGIYQWGYVSAEKKYQIIAEQQKNKINELTQKEAIIEKEIVIQYVDRVRKVKEIQTKIVEVTRDVLQEESTQCAIGPNFIGLHNQSASNQGIPTSTPGTVDTSTSTEPIAK
jgi:hypothetical protein